MAAREEIADAAFRLFSRNGYDETSVDDIAAAAGVSRSTFFRSYGSKEAVVFPDHDQLLDRIDQRLRASHTDSALAAVTDAVKLVLFHYVAEGERARERYRLTSSVPALKNRELVSTARYQRLFRSYLSRWGDGSETSELQAEIAAAAVVAAHNHVLRRWLRGQCEDPHAEVVAALDNVRYLFDRRDVSGPPAIIVVPAGTSMDAVQSEIRAALARSGSSTDVATNLQEAPRD
jgi:AcrR family transcriptional regulator